jgi:hypothetical protein
MARALANTRARTPVAPAPDLWTRAPVVAPAPLPRKQRPSRKADTPVVAVAQVQQRKPIKRRMDVVQTREIRKHHLANSKVQQS